MKLYTDGGARGNPGPGAAGAVLRNADNEVVCEKGTYLGLCTNNEAEYAGIKLGLLLALEKDITELACYLDSELVVKQLNGVYKVKNDRLQLLHKEIIELSHKFKSITFNHVPREQNKLADKIVNEILDSAPAP